MCLQRANWGIIVGFKDISGISMAPPAAPLRNVFLTSASKCRASTAKFHGRAGSPDKQNALAVANRKDKTARSTNGEVRLCQRGTMAVGTGQIRRAHLSNEPIDLSTEESLLVYIMRVCRCNIS